MSVQPDIIWNEQCLGIRIGEQVCTYLKKHDAEYQKLQKKLLELLMDTWIDEVEEQLKENIAYQGMLEKYQNMKNRFRQWDYQKKNERRICY